MIVSCARLAGELVFNQRGEEIGQVERIMIDVGSGRIAYALVACGGVLGIGERHYAIAWTAFTVDDDQRRLVLAGDPKDLQMPGARLMSSDTV